MTPLRCLRNVFGSACICRHVLVATGFYWEFNTVARAVMKWNKACDKRRTRLISYMWFTKDHWQYRFVGDNMEGLQVGFYSGLFFRRQFARLHVYVQSFAVFLYIGCARR